MGPAACGRASLEVSRYTKRPREGSPARTLLARWDDDDLAAQQRTSMASVEDRVEVWDWWHPKLRQLTFHAGASWEGIEERKGLQFVALAREIEGAVPVFDFWHSRLRQLTFHTGEPWEHEERKGLQFWAFPDPGPGRVPVFDYWHPKLRQLTFHTGMPWEDEECKGLQFYAYPPPAARSKLEAYVEALDAPRPAHHAAADEDWVMTTRADAEIPLAAAVAVSSDNRQALVERGEKISRRRCHGQSRAAAAAETYCSEWRS